MPETLLTSACVGKHDLDWRKIALSLSECIAFTGTDFTNENHATVYLLHLSSVPELLMLSKR